MKIPAELLAEKNYEGSRLILIEDEKITELHKMLDEYQKEVNPVLDKLQEGYYSKIDPMYQEVQALNEKIKGIKEQIGELTAQFKSEIELIEATDQKAQLVKNKMQPIILKAVEGQLGEFEIARHTVVRDGQIYVEVFDEIEEKIKAIRAKKQ